MNEFLSKWQPKNEERGELELIRDYGFTNPTETHVHCSEGDTLFIVQKNWNGENIMAIDRGELYNIIFNYMNTEELAKIIEERKKANKI